MAEGVFRKLAKEAGVKDMEASSAGVAAQPGSAASAETLTVLKKQGVHLEGFQSEMVSDTVLEEAEAVFCMTNGHLEMLEMMHPEYEEKYHLVCDFVEVDGKVGVDVPDPIGMGREAYELTSEVLNEAIAGVLAFLESRESSK